MKYKTRKFTISLVLLAFLICLVSLLDSSAAATCISELKLANAQPSVSAVHFLNAEHCTARTDYSGYSSVAGAKQANVAVLNYSLSATGAITTAADGSYPVSYAMAGVATDTDIAGDENIPSSQTDITPSPSTSPITPSPSAKPSVAPASPPTQDPHPSTIPHGSVIFNDNQVINNDGEQTIPEISDDTQPPAPSPSFPVVSPVSPQNESTPKEIVKKVWKFVKKNNYVATSGTSTALIVFVGISLIYDFKLIFWYRKKKKEEKSCKY